MLRHRRVGVNNRRAGGGAQPPRKRVTRSGNCAGDVTQQIGSQGGVYRAGGFFGDAIPPGWPDITGLLPGGRFIGVECKAKRGRQSAAQRDMQREIARRGGIYVLARDTKDLQAALGELGQ